MNVFFPVAGPDSPSVHRLRVRCLSGPWSDGSAPCVRYIDVPPQASLYDLHEAIQDAVSFDGDRPFHYFLAEDPADESDREVVPGAAAGHAPDSLEECAVYEDVDALPSVPENGDRVLHYLSETPDGPWIFEVTRTGESRRPVPGLQYPGLAEELSEGPDPCQYGWPLDGAFDDPDSAPDPASAGKAGVTGAGDREVDSDEESIEAALREIDGLGE